MYSQLREHIHPVVYMYYQEERQHLLDTLDEDTLNALIEYEYDLDDQRFPQDYLEELSDGLVFSHIKYLNDYLDTH